MRWWITMTLLAALLWTAGAVWASGEISGPVRIQAGGKPIGTLTGHAAPYVYDWDGDGTQDLLVGQMGGGKLRIYRNVGSNAEPRFEDFQVFRAGESEATVPSG